MTPRTDFLVQMMRLSMEQMLKDWRRLVGSDYPTADLNAAIGQLANQMQDILRTGRPQ